MDEFVEKMNQWAQALGLEDTHFQNPTRLAARGQYSSVRDLASMARAASAYPEFLQMAATDCATVTAQDREIELWSTNELLLAPRYRRQDRGAAGRGPKPRRLGRRRR